MYEPIKIGDKVRTGVYVCGERKPMSRLRNYVVLLTELHAEEDPPIAFPCMAEDADHAEEQAADAYPGCEIDFVMATASVASAYRVFEGDGPDGI